MEWFKFKDFDSSDYLIVKVMAPIMSAQKNITTYDVAGRNGRLNIDEGTYAPLECTIECVLTEDTNIDTIKASLTGVGDLELSTAPDRTYRAKVVNQIDFSRYLGWIREFPVQFELDPIAYSTTETTVTKTADATFDNDLGNIAVYPILEVKGNGAGTVVLNNVTITFSDLTSTATIVDCALMEVTKSGVSANDKINCDEFPQVIIGTNTLDLTGVDEVVIKYKAGWL